MRSGDAESPFLLNPVSLEETSVQPGLPDDAQKSPDTKLLVIWDGYRSRSAGLRLPHDNVAASTPNFFKSMLRKQAANVAA